MLQKLFPHKPILRQVIESGIERADSASDRIVVFLNVLHATNLPIVVNTRLARLTTKEEKKDEAFLTEPVFQHVAFAPSDVANIKYEHRQTNGFRDQLTYNFVKFLKNSYGLMTGYQEAKDLEHRVRISKSPDRMTIEKWLTRFVVLESVAGIPGSVAGFLRHLDSMRSFKRDMGFIDTLYDEAFNERMHLLIFLKMAQPTKPTRALLWVGQGIFANAFFITYIVSPKTCHRFVGYLEEEAVDTYTRCLEDMEAGLCPELSNHPVPNIAKNYYHLEGNVTMYELIQLIRADEAKHREVNHTFANLELEGNDRNPFALQIGDQPQPSKDLSWHHATGWERKELLL